MHVHAIETPKITSECRDLYAILDAHLPAVAEHSILAVTSKIISICQGRIVPIGSVDKQELVEREADEFLPPGASQYDVALTIKGQRLIPMAGIDESNSGGYYVLWPREPQRVANAVRAYLQQRFACGGVGVIFTDSTPTPLRWGVTGVAIAHSGFRAINDYRGAPDLFGQPLRMTQVNVADALAAAAVLAMGEGAEQTPLALIHDVSFVSFQARDPTEEELDGLRIERADDLYAPLLTGAPWRRGGR